AHGARTIYVVSPGTLRKTFVKPGQLVAKGDKIARLENPELERSLIQMRGQRDELAARIDDLRLLLFRDPAAALEIERLKVLLDSINQQMDEKEEQLSQLRIAAPVSGQIIPSSFRANGQTGENQLPTWTGWALEDKNIGAFLAEKTEVCRIGDAGRLEAVMLIDQADIELVAVDQLVTLQLESRSGEKLTGKIAKISPRELSEIPPCLTKQGGGDIMTEFGPEGTLRPASTVYQARVLINTSSVHQIGLRGTANIRTESRSLGSRFLRYLARTFHFEL
ncbi:MAG: HlyD family efflux transporter periplasmic adaptor subunit, partial [Planctomycetes bacterium]|nr:HlyD family efflux transporter periplasmic adaptor subunit [Planctomycetota bacterium]